MSTPGRVAILVENLPVPLDRRVWQEACALRDAGWNVTVIGPRGSARDDRHTEPIEGIEVFGIRSARHWAPRLPAEYVPSILATLALLMQSAPQGPDGRDPRL